MGLPVINSGSRAITTEYSTSRVYSSLPSLQWTSVSSLQNPGSAIKKEHSLHWASKFHTSATPLRHWLDNRGPVYYSRHKDTIKTKHVEKRHSFYMKQDIWKQITWHEHYGWPMGLFTDNDRGAMSFGVTYTVQVDKTITICMTVALASLTTNKNHKSLLYFHQCHISGSWQSFISIIAI